ncbi:hypothetical protein LPJ54_006376 [Coemansia sp. RSA 1824]|nr:hypothetical protein LPJ54_006376 [Coemansia sp. RSA 1824]
MSDVDNPTDDQQQPVANRRIRVQETMSPISVPESANTAEYAFKYAPSQVALMQMRIHMVAQLPTLRTDVNKDDKLAIPVGQWLAEVENIMQIYEVAQDDWCSLATLKMTLMDRTKFHDWRAMGSLKGKASWNELREFALRMFAGITNKLDAGYQWSRLQAPKNCKEYETFVLQYKNLSKLIGMDLDSQYAVVMLLMKLPEVVYLRILSSAAIDANLMMAQVVSHGLAYYIAQDSGAMDVDALSSPGAGRAEAVHVDAVRNGRGPFRNPPPYRLVQSTVSKEEYDRRVKDFVCIACGGDHLFKDHPKGLKA